jgi:O-methyltransferase
MMNADCQPETARRYLELLKHALTFTLWPEPLRPIEHLNDDRAILKRTAVSLVSGVLRRYGYHLTQRVNPTWQERRDGSILPYSADTMMGLTRLTHLQECIETVIREKIPGDLIEAGVWRGGGCIFMRGVLAAYGISDRTVYVADSFRGFPQVESPEDSDARPEHYHSYLAVPLDTVRGNFTRFGLLDDRVVFLQGWFKDTLPKAPIEQLSILRTDGDMYSSTMDALEALYPRIAPGGFCIVDDYGAVDACRKAVTAYRTANGITAEIRHIDWTGAFWRA